MALVQCPLARAQSSEAPAPSKAHYPMTTCPISGEELRTLGKISPERVERFSTSAETFSKNRFDAYQQLAAMTVPYFDRDPKNGGIRKTSPWLT